MAWTKRSLQIGLPLSLLGILLLPVFMAVLKWLFVYPEQTWLMSHMSLLLACLAGLFILPAFVVKKGVKLILGGVTILFLWLTMNTYAYVDREGVHLNPFFGRETLYAWNQVQKTEIGVGLTGKKADTAEVYMRFTFKDGTQKQIGCWFVSDAVFAKEMIEQHGLPVTLLPISEQAYERIGQWPVADQLELQQLYTGTST